MNLMELNIQLFASSKSTTFSESNFDYNKNTSSLTINIYFSANNTSTYFSGKILSCTCNGSTQSKSVSHPIKGSCSTSFTFNDIKHDYDGDKTVSWSWSCATGTNGLGTISDSGNFPLTKIPKASTLTWNASYFGDPIYININRNNSSFTDSLYFFCIWDDGTTYGREILSKSTLNAFTYEIISADLMNDLIHNNSVRQVKCILESSTYNGNIEIGGQHYEFTLPIKQLLPDISATITDTNATTIGLTGDSSKIIKYMSKPKTIIKEDVKQYATVKSYKTVCGSSNSNTKETTFNSIDNEIISVSVTDSRELSNSTTYNLKTLNKWIDYVKLSFVEVSIERIEQTASTIKATIRGTFFNGNFGTKKNTLFLKYRYREAEGEWSEYFELIPTITNNTFNYTNLSLRTDVDYKKNYEFEVIAKDELIETNPIRPQISKGQGVFEIGDEFVNINGELYVNDVEINKKNYSITGLNIGAGVTITTYRDKFIGAKYIVFYFTSNGTQHAQKFYFPNGKFDFYVGNFSKVGSNRMLGIYYEVTKENDIITSTYDYDGTTKITGFVVVYS